MEQDRKNETADVASYQIGTPTINVQPEKQYAVPAKRKVTSRKFADPNTKNSRK